jgi:UDP-GlcNAc3NAcA epimerase
MKIITIIGARPQFIKAAAVSREIRKHPEIQEIIVHTGQHFDKNMSEVFFEELEIPKPDYNLDIHGLSHGAMTGRMLEEIEKILLKENPDYVLVYGDTNSTLAGALAARKQNIKLIHIEAGLRSLDMSVPEEVNRILTDRISSILFCPSDAAINHLKTEGFDNFDCKIVRTGDVMYDAAMFYSQKSDEKSNILEQYNLQKENYILSTIHRAENVDNIESLKQIILAFNRISKEIPIVLPLHPRTKSIMEKNNIKTEFNIIPPVGYLDMIALLKNCKMVICDSGGLQKEAYMFGKNSLVLLEHTPWEELVINGFTIETSCKEEVIYENYKKSLEATPDYSIKLYGKGQASKEIVDVILNYKN